LQCEGRALTPALSRKREREKSSRYSTRIQCWLR
jgi:hypothetical protein